MPKYSELSVEIAVNKVSCPGVWLCQQGKVSLTLFALGTSYQTTLSPPLFPIVFKEVFHFKKTFRQTCAFHNVPCLLKDESVYCELVQWSGDCRAEACAVLAQYLGSLADVLFPPSVCCCDGVDLLMRRTDHFPGILAPKIEVTTTVRLDEVWRREAGTGAPAPPPAARQARVCHSPMYHRRHHDPFKKFRSKSSDSRSCEMKCRNYEHAELPPEPKPRGRHVRPPRRAPCDCAICRRYDQLFHADEDG